MKVRSVRKWSVKVTVAMVVSLCLLQGVFAQIKSAETSALIPQPQKINWNNQVFHPDGNESRIVLKIVARLSGVVVNREEA